MQRADQCVRAKDAVGQWTFPMGTRVVRGKQLPIALAEDRERLTSKSVGPAPGPQERCLSAQGRFLPFHSEPWLHCRPVSVQSELGQEYGVASVDSLHGLLMLSFDCNLLDLNRSSKLAGMHGLSCFGCPGIFVGSHRSLNFRIESVADTKTVFE